MNRYLRIMAARRAPTDESGFTLIELLIVIAVLGILSAVVVFSLANVTGNSAVAACNSDAKSVETAITAYDAQNAAEPVDPCQLTVMSCQSGDGATETTAAGEYLHSWPNSTYYTISIGTGTDAGDVMVTAPTTGTAKPYDVTGSSDPCANA